MERADSRDLAQQIFGASRERRALLLAAAWPKAVGLELSRRTEVVALEGDVLRIRIPDAGWRRVLLRIRPEILSRLRALAGRLAPRGLSFVEGGGPGRPAEPGPGASPPSARATLPAPAPPERLLAEAERIADPELRAAFLASAGRYLQRFRSAHDA